MAHMELKKKRMLTYFIKSAQDIMTAEGMQGITLRKVADGAGYNNATLYNYFDDLDHVVLYACLKYLSLYNNSVAKELKSVIPQKNASMLCGRFSVRFLSHILTHFIRFFLINTVVRLLQSMMNIISYSRKNYLR